MYSNHPQKKLASYTVLLYIHTYCDILVKRHSFTKTNDKTNDIMSLPFCCDVPKSDVLKHMPREPRKKTTLTFHYPAYLIVVLVMVYEIIPI